MERRARTGFSTSCYTGAIMKPTHTVIIGGGPAGAIAAELIARGGGRVTVFEEKVGWEKPCGGGLTHKALQRYPFLLPATGEREARPGS